MKSIDVYKRQLFNELTGSNQYVGNWPGVTVEKKSGQLKGHPDVSVVDLPGIYSLSPYSAEELVTRNFVLEGNPDVILDAVSYTHLDVYKRQEVLCFWLQWLAMNSCGEHG